jgi:hypothetical protein
MLSIRHYGLSILQTQDKHFMELESVNYLEKRS